MRAQRPRRRAATRCEGGAAPPSRRRALAALPAAAAWALLPGRAALAARCVSAECEPRTVLITGCNSGIGLAAARRLAEGGHTLILACRSLDEAQAAKANVAGLLPEGADANERLVPAECDLSSLESVRALATRARRDAWGLDVLALNAGAQFTGAPEPLFTREGFELTVGANHLGHFLLANLLLPAMSASGRIVVTSSEVHDPESAGGSVGPGATLGSLDGMRGGLAGMVDGGEWDGDKAYKDSKLCNLLFAREMASRLQAAGSKVTANAFGPGLITTSDFFSNNKYQKEGAIKAFSFIASKTGATETKDGGGRCLEFMALAPELEGTTGVYYNNTLRRPGKHDFRMEDGSAESKDAAEAAELWLLSTQLTEAPEELALKWPVEPQEAAAAVVAM